QFPRERLRWSPAAWDKPVVYFYAKPSSLNVSVKVTFPEGAPVVWWPAVADPLDRRTIPAPGGKPEGPRPFRSLTWDVWPGERVPATQVGAVRAAEGVAVGEWTKASDFPLPPGCWLREARLPGASPVTVRGNTVEGPKKWFPGAMDRPETERFLYYD